ncbi:hypothetical protein Nepgr_032809 [Nepenthes gracilis]|uniref:Uncharacterized protein n=1 Tax=Nepenthes gracilis TaxID=150966 RepID=A0AAD3TKX6_NEPGR|nr:hypothetical protein Nepgr_032809 [Nepenthes gracilis]
MEVSASRGKKVIEPFNEKVRARIFRMSSLSSGSGNGGDDENDVDSPSPCLSNLVRNFLEDQNGVDEPPPSVAAHAKVSDSEEEFGNLSPTAMIEDVIDPVKNADRFRNILLGHVVKAVEMFSTSKTSKTVFNGNIAAYLSENGYDAGICKTRWNSSSGGGLSAGNYEFIDVIVSESVRYFVDTDFASQFEIARETENYGQLRNALPKVFVGKCEDLKRIVRVLCDEAKRSMKSNGLSLPPWRKNRYMQAKWFGPYRRTVIHLPSNPSAQLIIPKITVQCRSVGFDDGGRSSVPPATWTR